MSFLDNLFILQSIDNTDTGITAKLRCNPEHPVYQAHFPGNPITPGACLLKTAGEVLQQKLGRPLYLTEIENGCKTQVVIADETSVYTKMSLTFSYEPL